MPARLPACATQRLRCTHLPLAALLLPCSFEVMKACGIAVPEDSPQDDEPGAGEPGAGEPGADKPFPPLEQLLD